jgi:hypothetical protein
MAEPDRPPGQRSLFDFGVKRVEKRPPARLRARAVARAEAHAVARAGEGVVADP